MIEPGNNGRRSGGVARGAARHVTSRKTGIHLTWILPSTALRSRSASPLRWPWRNPNPFSNLRNRCRARPKRVFLHIDSDVTCAPLDRHRARRKPPPESWPPARRSASSGTAAERIAAEAISGRIPPPRASHLADKASLRDVSVAQIVQSINREESNNGTHETKSALLRRRRMDSPPFVKGLTGVFLRAERRIGLWRPGPSIGTTTDAQVCSVGPCGCTGRARSRWPARRA